MNKYILYKEPISLDILYLIQYLYSQGIDFRPNVIIERNFPEDITQLPTVRYENNLYSGLDQIVKFYEECSDIPNLLQKAKQFKEENPNYTIN
jgi:hypothetical protein